MAPLWEHLSLGHVVAAVTIGLLVCVALVVWRRARTNLAWERGVAIPMLRQSVQHAIRSHRTHTGIWPKGKREIERRLDADEQSVRLAGEWDCKLLTTSRDGRKARYSLLISGAWTDWDVHAESTHHRRERHGCKV